MPVSDAVVTLAPDDQELPIRVQILNSKPVTMDQKGRKFVPHVLVVGTGSTVRFPNSDAMKHHVYSFSPAKRFELKLYSGQMVPTVVFDQPGIVSIGCNIHDWMRGYIYVSDEPLVAVTDAAGRAPFEGLLAGEYKAIIWHPRIQRPPGDGGKLVKVNSGTSMTRDFGIDLNLPSGRQHRGRSYFQRYGNDL